MIFKNFDNIGLKNEEEIKNFLGKMMVSYLVSTEYYLQEKLSKAENFFNKSFDKKQEIVVCLLNQTAESGVPFICVIEPYISVSHDEVRYDYYTHDGIEEKRQYPKFKTKDKACQFVENLYGLNSHQAVAEKSKQLSDEVENG